MGDINNITVRYESYGAQGCAGAGTMTAEAIMDAKQGSMGCTLDKLTSDIHELIRHPVKVYSRVRAGIDISVDIGTGAHQENILTDSINADGEPSGCVIRDIGKAAKPLFFRRHRLRL